MKRQEAGTMERRQADAFLRSVTWLAQAPTEFQEQVLLKCDMLRFGRSDLIYDAGDEASGLFGIVEGHVEIHLLAPGIEATLSYIAGPGAWFGDIAAVTGQPRKIAIIAGSDCQVVRLPRIEVARMSTSDPRVLRHFLSLLAINYAKTLSVVSILKQSDPIKRIAAMLLMLSEDNVSSPTISASQSDLAELTHLGRSKVNASLKMLETSGLVRRRYGSIEIANATKLRELIC